MTFINFNNKNVGDIDKFIINKHFNDNGDLINVELNIQDDLSLSLVKYKNDFPLILDEIKHLFSICRTYYDVVTVEDKKYLAYKNLNEITLRNYKDYSKSNKDLCREDARRMFVFLYLMCIKDISLNEENNIYVRPLLKSGVSDTKKSTVFCLISIENKGFNYFTNDCKIPSSVVKEWFDGSSENFYKYVGEMINDLDVDSFKVKAIKIIKKFDDNYLSWLNSVYEHLLNCKVYC
jgi:hypothetical protein